MSGDGLSWIDDRGHTTPQFRAAAVRYATRKAKASEVFLSFWAYGEPDRVPSMDYHFCVVRDEQGWVLIDTGCSVEVAQRRGRTSTLDRANPEFAARVS